MRNTRRKTFCDGTVNMGGRRSRRSSRGNRRSRRTGRRSARGKMTHRPRRYRASEEDGAEKRIHDFLDLTVNNLRKWKPQAKSVTNLQPIMCRFIIEYLSDAWFAYQGFEWYFNKHGKGPELGEAADAIKWIFQDDGDVSWPMIESGIATHSIKGKVVNDINGNPQADFSGEVDKRPLVPSDTPQKCVITEKDTRFVCPHCNRPFAEDYMNLHLEKDTLMPLDCKFVSDPTFLPFSDANIAALRDMKAKGIPLADKIEGFMSKNQVKTMNGLQKLTPPCLPWYCEHDGNGHILCTNVHDPSKTQRFIAADGQTRPGVLPTLTVQQPPVFSDRSDRSYAPDEAAGTLRPSDRSSDLRTASQTPLPDSARSGSTEYPSTGLQVSPLVRAVTPGGGAALSFQDRRVPSTPDTMEYA